MNRIALVLFAVLLFMGCATQETLYTWNNYEVTSYNYLKNTDEKSTQELIETYKKIIKKQQGKRGIVPPGIYADYGFLLLQTDKKEEGMAMLQKEVELYPESRVFIERILNMVKE
jgi:hypothetical protein